MGDRPAEWLAHGVGNGEDPADELRGDVLCGAEGIRTPDPLDANEVRYQLRHSP